MKLELGCGDKPTPGYVHHDRIKHAPYVDLAWDLNKTPWPFMGGAGEIVTEHKDSKGYPLQTEFLDEIMAIDVFEHLSLEVRDWMNECWRLLKPGGQLIFRVPAFDNPVSWRDPTHKRVFHPQTFEYWDPRSELQQRFGSIYFAEDGKWWQQEGLTTEYDDLRFVLTKLGSH